MQVGGYEQRQNTAGQESGLNDRCVRSLKERLTWAFPWLHLQPLQESVFLKMVVRIPTVPGHGHDCHTRVGILKRLGESGPNQWGRSHSTSYL